MADKIYTVTVASGNLYGGGTGNVFYLDGVRNSTGPGTIQWVQGATLRFDQSEGTNDNHPLIFSNNSNTTGIISSGITYYLDGASNQANYTNTTTFNAATTRYIEITPSSTTDLYYMCWVHGLGMGGIFDITINTWGSAGWGNNSWESLTSLIDVSGQQVALSVGDSAATPSTGFGAGFWGFGEFGRLQNQAGILTGVAVNTTVASVSITTEINAGYGANTWGFTNWGAVGDAAPTGLSLSSTLADVTITTSVTQGWSRGPWGEQVWGDSNEAGAATGQALATTLASVTIDGEINEGWGRLTWGADAWGIAADTLATGQSLTSTIGTVSVGAEVNAGWGRLTWGENDWGAATLSQTVSPTGVSMATSLGSEIASIDITANVQSEFNPGFGSVIGWGQQLWGTAVVNIQMSTAQGTVDADPDAEFSGQQLATAIGSVAITGTATIDVTGQLLDIQDGAGTGEAVTLVDVSGQQLATAVRSAVAGASAEAVLTGIQLNTTIGVESINSWNEIDPNNSAVWTEIAA
tara:strand:+ start:7142 stop:8710 length:1569 start_codon:yes stop_codon:yes gene_type:complete